MFIVQCGCVNVMWNWILFFWFMLHTSWCIMIHRDTEIRHWHWWYFPTRNESVWRVWWHQFSQRRIDNRDKGCPILRFDQPIRDAVFVKGMLAQELYWRQKWKPDRKKPNSRRYLGVFWCSIGMTSIECSIEIRPFTRLVASLSCSLCHTCGYRLSWQRQIEESKSCATRRRSSWAISSRQV